MVLLSSQNSAPETEFDSTTSAFNIFHKLLGQVQDSIITNTQGDAQDQQIVMSGQKTYRKQQLQHKLFRIEKELEFVKNNIDAFKGLTPREKEVIQLLTKGKNNPEIAEFLCISRSTVEQHRKHINHKLKITSFSQFMRFCYAFDFI